MAVFAALWGEWDAANRSGLVQPVCSAAAPAKDMDTVGADLWGNARRHNAVVVDTDAVAHMEAAGLVRMDHDFLLCRMVQTRSWLRSTLHTVACMVADMVVVVFIKKIPPTVEPLLGSHVSLW